MVPQKKRPLPTVGIKSRNQLNFFVCKTVRPFPAAVKMFCRSERVFEKIINLTSIKKNVATMNALSILILLRLRFQHSECFSIPSAVIILFQHLTENSRILCDCFEKRHA